LVLDTPPGNTGGIDSRASAQTLTAPTANQPKPWTGNRRAQKGKQFMGDVTRVMIVDDHPLIRATVRRALIQAGMLVVGECDDGTQVVPTATIAQPDVVIMDIRMPIKSGIEATKDLLACWPTVRVLMHTATTHSPTLQQAAAAGAAGCVAKGGDTAQLIDAVRTVTTGGTAWPPGGATQTCRVSGI